MVSGIIGVAEAKTENTTFQMMYKTMLVGLQDIRGERRRVTIV